MASFVNNTTNFNKEICFVETDLCASVGGAVNLLPQIFATYDNFSLDNGPSARYIDVLENSCNDGTLTLESKDFMDKS